MIKDTIEQEGKLSIIELPKILNVPIEKIETRIESVIKKYKFFLIDGVLITNTYLDKLSDEINEDLIKKSELHISDLAIKYEFSVPFIFQTITDRLGIIIDGLFTPDGSKLLTQGYINILNAQIKGVMRSQWGPCNIQQISKKYSLDEQKVEGFLQDLITNKQLLGKIQNGMYFPDRFIDKQEQLLRSYFDRNGMIEYDFIKTQFYAPKPKQFLQKFLSDEAILLDTCAFSSKEMKQIPETINNLVEENGYAESYDIFPANFTNKDIEQILFKELDLPAIKFENGILLSDIF